MNHDPSRSEERNLEARKLLLLGALAGPLYLGVGFGQAFTREGFDMTRHALSHLSNGDLGWIQIANFIVAGLLVAAGAVGVRRQLRGERGGRWGPILLAAYAVGLVGAGVFVADPAPGFPPETLIESPSMSRAGFLHFVFGAVGFYALVGACVALGNRFRHGGERGWAVYSFVTAAGFLVSFGAVASGSTAPATRIAFYGAVSWIWLWHMAVHLKLLGRARSGGAA